MKKIFLILTLSLLLLVINYSPSLASRFVIPQNNDNQSVKIHSQTINDNLFVYGKNIDINSPVKGDLFVFGSNVHINQPVSGNIFVIGASTTINNKINHDAFIYAKDLKLNDTAKIAGSLYARTDQINKFNPKLILGSTKISQSKKNTATHTITMTRVFLFLSMLITGLVMLKFLPKTLGKVIESSKHDWGKSILISVLALILTPVIIALLIATLVGIPLAIILSLIFAIDIYLGAITIAYVMGKFIFKDKIKEELILFIGLLIIQLLGSNQFTEPFAKILIVYGFGLLLNAEFKIIGNIHEKI